jgi:glutathione S-transferase
MKRDSMTELPLLLHFRISNYNEKVRWALDLKRVPHRRETLIPGLHMPRVRALTGQNQVPVLEAGGEAHVGSSRILRLLEERYPEPALYPRDPAELGRALALESLFDRLVAPDLRLLVWDIYLRQPDACARMATDGFGPTVRLLWRSLLPLTTPLFRKNLGIDRRGVVRARRTLDDALCRLEAEIRPSGYLVGESFSVADLAVAALMSPVVRPPELPYPLPEPWPAELTELCESIAERPAVRWVLDVYRRNRGGSAEVVAGAPAASSFTLLSGPVASLDPRLNR